MSREVLRDVFVNLGDLPVQLEKLLGKSPGQPGGCLLTGNRGVLAVSGFHCGAAEHGRPSGSAAAQPLLEAAGAEPADRAGCPVARQQDQRSHAGQVQLP